MEKNQGFGCLLSVKILTILLSSLSSTISSVMDTDSHVALALEICAMIPLDVDAIFQLKKINVHFCLLFIANSNFLNCIRRFIRSNECLNSTKFV